MCDLLCTPHSSLQKDNSLNHSYVSPSMGCLEYTEKNTYCDFSFSNSSGETNRGLRLSFFSSPKVVTADIVVKSTVHSQSSVPHSAPLLSGDSSNCFSIVSDVTVI